MTFTLALHAGACLYMTGVIWVIQLLHYPAFALVPTGAFVDFHARHTRLMGFVVGPVMVLELATALALAWETGGGWWLNLGAVATLFALTFLVSVPVHDRLARGADPALVARLTRTNWPRTLVWSLRSLALLAVQVTW